MAIIVNTNMSALKTQRNLTNATNGLNRALERMSTGCKINAAKDDAAGLYVATGLDTKIRAYKVAKNNISTGNNVLQIMESDLNNILENFQRVRDLATQAANSVYSDDAMQAMELEATYRLDEIDRISKASNFNGRPLLSGDDAEFSTNGLRLQVGSDANPTINAITIDKELFEAATDSSHLGGGTDTNAVTVYGDTVDGTKSVRENLEAGALLKSTAAADFIAILDAAINDVSNRKSKIGATMNRLETAESSLTTTIENATAAKSTIMDADIAEESAEFTKQQILQQTSAALLAQANALPSIALNLIQR